MTTPMNQDTPERKGLFALGISLLWVSLGAPIAAGAAIGTMVISAIFELAEEKVNKDG